MSDICGKNKRTNKKNKECPFQHEDGLKGLSGDNAGVAPGYTSVKFMSLMSKHFNAQFINQRLSSSETQQAMKNNHRLPLT